MTAAARSRFRLIRDPESIPALTEEISALRDELRQIQAEIEAADPQDLNPLLVRKQTAARTLDAKLEAVDQAIEERERRIRAGHMRPGGRAS